MGEDEQLDIVDIAPGASSTGRIGCSDLYASSFE